MKSFLKNMGIIVIAGMILGIILYHTGFSFKEIYDETSTKGILIGLLLFIIIFQIAIIFHELGHLIFGLLTGYKFLSFRYQSFLVKKDHGKLVFKRYKVIGTAGQCLMIPPKKVELPIFWYNAGGVIVNLLLGIISLVVHFNVTHYYAKMAMVISCVINLMLILINWLPIKGISNDGNNYRETKKYPNSRKAFFHMLDINARLSNYERLTEITLDIDRDSLDQTKTIQATLVFYMAIQKMFENKVLEAKEEIEEIIGNISGINRTITPILEVYQYFILLILENEQALSKKTKNVTKILNIMKYEPTFMLVKWYENLLTTGINDQNPKESLEKMYDKSPTPGEISDLIDLRERLLSEYKEKQII